METYSQNAKREKLHVDFLWICGGGSFCGSDLFLPEQSGIRLVRAVPVVCRNAVSGAGPRLYRTEKVGQEDACACGDLCGSLACDDRLRPAELEDRDFPIDIAVRDTKDAGLTWYEAEQEETGWWITAI